MATLPLLLQKPTSKSNFPCKTEYVNGSLTKKYIYGPGIDKKQSLDEVEPPRHRPLIIGYWLLDISLLQITNNNIPDNKVNKTIYNILYAPFIGLFLKLVLSFDTNLLDRRVVVSYNY